MDYDKARQDWICHLPEGKIGTARINRFSVSDNDSAMSGLRRGGYVKAGNYTALHIDKYGLVMSDTSKEFRDHTELFRHAKGQVLVHGLGLGCCLNVLRNIPEVRSVTVVEINPDVIALVGPHFIDPKVSIVQGDAMTWQPPKSAHYDAVWHDIWASVCADNLPAMATLCRRYGRRADWQGCWSRGESQYRQKQEKQFLRRTRLEYI